MHLAFGRQMSELAKRLLLLSKKSHAHGKATRMAGRRALQVLTRWPVYNIFRPDRRIGARGLLETADG